VGAREEKRQSVYLRQQPATPQGLRNLLLDAIQLLEIADRLPEWEMPSTELPEPFWEQIVAARHALEAAVHTADPSWYSSRLARADSDQRIELASRFEEHEVEIQQLRGEARYRRVLSEAGRKLDRLIEEFPAEADRIRRLLSPSEGTDVQVRRSELVALGFTDAEVAVLIAHHSR